MTFIKICGLTRAVDAVHAEAKGASYLGVIFAGGPRQLDVDRARLVLGPRRAGIQRVGVFGGQDDATIVGLADTLDLDVIQLHNDPTVEQIRRLREATGRQLWPVVRMSGAEIPASAAALAGLTGALVLDAKTVGQLGGTGVALDWDAMRHSMARLRAHVSRRVSADDGARTGANADTHVGEVTIVLAGGLRPNTVADAMRLLQPDVVDVSSGVESAVGIKDHNAVEHFVHAVTAAKGK